MKNMLDYIEEYGNYSFKEKPFNEIDNLIFSQLAYTDFKNIADKQSVSLLKGAKLFLQCILSKRLTSLLQSVQKVPICSGVAVWQRGFKTLFCVIILIM